MGRSGARRPSVTSSAVIPITSTISERPAAVAHEPGPCPELRGSPAAPPGDSDGSAARAIAGSATTASQANVMANGRGRAGAPPPGAVLR